MAAHRARIVFHWVTFLLVALVYVLAFYHEGVEDPDLRLFWLDWHRALGLGVMALTVLRLLGRVVLPFEPVHEPNPLLRLGARATHVALYAGLVAMPLIGWAMSSAKMHKFKLFGTALPGLVKHNADLADQLGELHEALGWAILAVIGLHSAAALFHHFFKRDTVLLDMLRVRQ